MHIFIVGADTNYAIERPYIKYLSRIRGVSRVSFFKAQNFFLEYYHRSIYHKLLFRGGLSGIIGEINERLKREIEDRLPDVVWVFKGMELLPETIVWIKKRGVKVANYNPDNPFIFSGRGSGNANVSNSIGLYDLHFTYDKAVKERIEKEYNIRCCMLPFGFDLTLELFEKCDKIPEVVKTCFLGSADQGRASFINDLANTGIEIDVFGSNWSKYIRSQKVRFFPAIYGEEFWMTLRKYRIQLNLMRAHNPTSHNMRTFEVPGVGGIQLAPYTPDHSSYFEAGKEIFLFRDREECINQISKLLAMPTESAARIRASARSRSILSKYTYKDRALQVFNELEKVAHD
jgi:hypothetical protein